MRTRFASEGKLKYDLKTKAAHFLILIAGLCFIFLGVLIEVFVYTETIYGQRASTISNVMATIFLSFGAALTASFALFRLTWKSSVINREIEHEVVESWGVIGKFTYRQEIYASKYVTDIKKQLDICVLTAETFRNTVIETQTMKELIAERVRAGLELRIITVRPGSPFLVQREIDANKRSGSISTRVDELIDWIDDLKKIVGNDKSNNVSIRFYSSLPLDFYLRADNYLFIGQYLYGVESESTPTLLYQKDTNGFKFYESRFSDIWNDERLEKTSNDEVHMVG